MSSSKAIFAATCLLIACEALAEVYRWVDEDGRVHFGDRPGAVEADKLDIPDPPPQKLDVDQQQLDAERNAERQRLLDAFEEEREMKQRAKQEREAKERERQHNCIYARDILREYENTGSIYEPLAGGKRRYLSASERRQEIERARQEVRRWCDD